VKPAAWARATAWRGSKIRPALQRQPSETSHEGSSTMLRRCLRGLLGGVFLVLVSFIGCDSSKPTMAESPPPPVTVSQPVVRDVVNYDEYEGRIEAIPTVEVRARVRGHLIKIDFKDGQIVQKDALLFEIDPRTYKAELDGAEAQKAVAQASQKLAQATAERDERLVGTGA